MNILIAIGITYILFNLFVTWRINKSNYLNEERRGLHKKLIWVIPFIGPIIIIGFWTKRKVRPETMTKGKREKKKGDFYESGIGLNT